MKKALITGITGQDGSYIAELLASKNYEIHAIARRNSTQTLGNFELVNDNTKKSVKIYWGDITDESFISNLVKEIKPDEIFHLAAQSFVGLSFTNPKATYDTNISGTLNIANAVKNYSPKTKVYFAATSELYGKIQDPLQNENTPFYPRSPYGISKLAGFWTMKNYREAYNLFMSNGILFNHESERRGSEFVTRKITIGLAKIKLGHQEYLELGNIYAKRDWGHAKDYVEAMWLILQQEKPDDYVIATGQTHTIKEFIECVANTLDFELDWQGEGVDEIAIDKKTGKTIIKISKEFFRPAEVDILIGDSSKARTELNWRPRIEFEELAKIMAEYDYSISSLISSQKSYNF